MKAQLLSTIENSKGYTLAVAEAMPEDRYNFKPASSVWNFLELMNHIVYGINWYKENYIEKTKIRRHRPSKKLELVEPDNSAVDIPEKLANG